MIVMLKRTLLGLAIFTFVLQSVLAADIFPYSLADQAIEEAITDSLIPGAVLCVVEDGKISYLQAYGYRSVFPEQELMTPHTIFDLASVSKPLGAGSAILLLCAEKRLHINDFVSQYIPQYHSDVQVHHLLTHYSGLPAYMGATRLDSVYIARETNAARAMFMWDTIARCQRPSAVGEKYRYSCLNFISLQGVVEAIVGEDINSYMRNKLYNQLSINTMGWLPEDSLRHRIAPTECFDTTCLRGKVHDPLARIMMSGISGNAGIFATAEDVAAWAIWFMNLPAETRINGCNAGLWTDTVTTSSGSITPNCRHTGYTGTSITILPNERRALILLTNRVHPKDEHNLSALRKALNAMLTP
jgi:CubicO group peptidase (beta-lactamase class C family)